MTPALSARNLTVRFPGQPETVAVRGVDLEIGEGEVVGLVGESGCGKSSLASALLGIPDRSARISGEVKLGDQTLTNLGERDLRRIRGRDISMVFQEPLTALDPVFTIGSQLGEILRRHGAATRRNVAQRSREALQGMNLGDIPNLLRSYPHQLSGGMRQRVSIAMAMACRPAVLLADEPTTALDVTTQAEVLDTLLRARQANGTGILFITHDLAVAASICDRIIVMREGVFVENAPVARLLANPAHPYTASLLDADPSLGKRRPHREHSEDEPLLALRQHSVSHRINTRGRQRQLDAVRGVDLEIRKGEILALVGESGSGKSTLAQSLLGLLPADNDSIVFSGQSVNTGNKTVFSNVRRHVSLVFQDPRASLSPRRTVGQALVEPLDHFSIGSQEERPGRIARVLEQVGLEPVMASRYPHELSGGQRQRVALARALISEPDLVVADEPLSSLDVSIQAKIIELLLQLRRDLGFAVLIVSHDLAAMRTLADRIAVMYLGRIMETAPTETLFENPAHPYTRALLGAMPTLERHNVQGSSTRLLRPGEPPSLLTPPPGCVFHTRCPDALDRCKRVTPAEQRINGKAGADHSHTVHCLLYENQD